MRASEREGSRLSLGGILVRDYVRAPDLNTEPPWLCDGDWIGRSCQGRGRNRRWEVCGGEGSFCLSQRTALGSGWLWVALDGDLGGQPQMYVVILRNP